MCLRLSHIDAPDDDLPQQRQWKEFHGWDNCQSGCISSDPSSRGVLQAHARGATGSLDRCYRLVWGVRLSAVAKGAICDECYIYASATCASGFHCCVSSSFRLLSSRSTTCWLWHEDIFCHQCYHKVIPILLEFRPLCVVARDADMAIVMNRQAWENVRKCEKWSRTIGVNPDHDNVTRRTTFWQLNIYFFRYIYISLEFQLLVFSGPCCCSWDARAKETGVPGEGVWQGIFHIVLINYWQGIFHITHNLHIIDKVSFILSFVLEPEQDLFSLQM